MTEIAVWALVNLIKYGLPILLLVSFLGSLGVPFPNTPVIIAAGALSRGGIFAWYLAAFVSLLGAMLADISEFFIGRWAGKWFRRRFGQKMDWQRAMDQFTRHGDWAILLTRFWLMPLAPPVNVIAGSQYPFWRFVLFVFIGELVWVLIYGGLGYIFAEELEWAIRLVENIGWISLALVIVGIGAFLLLRRRRRSQAIL
jgi:membrane protein DedA with SNARE-associated domain